MDVSLDALVEGAKSGRLVSFPTDTVPALAVRPDRAALIFAAKGRSQQKPLILMGADPGDLWGYVQGTPEERQIWQGIAARYWPGALTLVLPAAPTLPQEVNPTDPTTIGLRVPDCAIAQQVLARTAPLATTSINRSGEPPLQDPQAIAAQFPEVLLLQASYWSDVKTQGLRQQSIIDSIPSTVVKWNAGTWQVLRQGAVTFTVSG